MSHSFKDETQILKIQFKKTIKHINLNLIGKIQLKNLLMAIIAAERSKINLKKFYQLSQKLNQWKEDLKKLVISKINQK